MAQRCEIVFPLLGGGGGSGRDLGGSSLDVRGGERVGGEGRRWGGRGEGGGGRGGGGEDGGVSVLITSSHYQVSLVSCSRITFCSSPNGEQKLV